MNVENKIYCESAALPFLYVHLKLRQMQLNLKLVFSDLIFSYKNTFFLKFGSNCYVEGILIIRRKKQ